MIGALLVVVLIVVVVVLVLAILLERVTEVDARHYRARNDDDRLRVLALALPALLVHLAQCIGAWREILEGVVAVCVSYRARDDLLLGVLEADGPALEPRLAGVFLAV